MQIITECLICYSDDPLNEATNMETINVIRFNNKTTDLGVGSPLSASTNPCDSNNNTDNTNDATWGVAFFDDGVVRVTQPPTDSQPAGAQFFGQWNTGPPPNATYSYSFNWVHTIDETGDTSGNPTGPTQSGSGTFSIPASGPSGSLVIDAFGQFTGQGCIIESTVVINGTLNITISTTSDSGSPSQNWTIDITHSFTATNLA